MLALAALLVGIGWGAFLLFKDTLNRVQYVRFPLTLKYLYWLTRDSGGKGTPFFERRVFMRMTAYPWLSGDRAIKFRIPTGKTFQVGIAYKKQYASEDEALRDIMGAHEWDIPVEEIRDLEPSKLVKKES